MVKHPPPNVGYNFGNSPAAMAIFQVAQNDAAAITSLRQAVQNDAVLKLELDMDPDARGAKWKFQRISYHVLWEWNPKPRIVNVYDIRP